MEEVLYRKYRPLTFDEVRGQEHIVRALRNQVISGRLNHAYLFSGIRGTGKTTVARILARAINCEHPVNGNPCNKCDNCKAILKNESMNVMEWDAAVSGRIDNIRDIEQIITARPIHGYYRVFILDETQFMQRYARNALLKTLEEPPEWIVFILSTTEPELFEQTILSRCQKYEFKRMDQNTIIDQLQNVLRKEARSIDERGLTHIASVSEGSMRDALSLLNTVLTYNTSVDIDYDQTLRALETSDKTACDTLIQNMYDHNLGKAMGVTNAILASGISEEQLIADILQYLRDLFMIKNDDVAGVVATDDQKQKMISTANRMDTDRIINMMVPFHDVLKEIRFLTSKRIALEIAIVQASSSDDREKHQEIERRLKRLEETLLP